MCWSSCVAVIGRGMPPTNTVVLCMLSRTSVETSYCLIRLSETRHGLIWSFTGPGKKSRIERKVIIPKTTDWVNTKPFDISHFPWCYIWISLSLSLSLSLPLSLSLNRSTSLRNQANQPFCFFLLLLLVTRLVQRAEHVYLGKKFSRDIISNRCPWRFSINEFSRMAKFWEGAKLKIIIQFLISPSAPAGEFFDSVVSARIALIFFKCSLKISGQSWPNRQNQKTHLLVLRERSKIKRWPSKNAVNHLKSIHLVTRHVSSVSKIKNSSAQLAKRVTKSKVQRFEIRHPSSVSLVKK